MASWQAWKHRICGALFAGVLSTQAMAADPVVSITASSNPAVIGSTIDLDVLISGVTDLYGFQFTLNFDPAVLQALGGSEGAFLSAGGSTFFDAGTIDNTLGSVSFAFNSLIGAVPGVSGDGVLARFSFSASGLGSSAISFSDALFINASLAELPAQLQGISLQVVAVPEPSTYLLFGAGLVGVMVLRRRRFVEQV